MSRQREGGGNLGWLALAGAGVAAGLWIAGTLRRRPPGVVGAHAWLVPIEQARTEAKWTGQALVHASESKHG